MTTGWRGDRRRQRDAGSRRPAHSRDAASDAASEQPREVLVIEKSLPPALLDFDGVGCVEKYS